MIPHIHHLRIRYVPVDPDEADQRRRTLLELQVRSIVAAARKEGHADSSDAPAGDATDPVHGPSGTP